MEAAWLHILSAPLGFEVLDAAAPEALAVAAAPITPP
jgi:hypothetical protein